MKASEITDSMRRAILRERNYQCDWCRDSVTNPRCTKKATRKWGNHWFCDVHGERSRTDLYGTKNNTPNPELPEHQDRQGKEEGNDSPMRPELERRAPASAVGKTDQKEGDSRRFLVRVTSFRRRLIDEDNLCEKFVVDCCRHSGLLPDDCPEQTKIEVGQVKTGKEEEGFTLVEIFETARSTAQAEK